MEEVALADGADFAIAEKAGNTERAEFLLDHAGVVVGRAEKVLSAAVATAQTAAIDGAAGKLRAGADEEVVQVLGGGLGVAAVELDGLAGPEAGADGDVPGTRIGADQITDEEIAAMKLFQVFVDDEADEEVAAGLALVGGGKGVEGFGEDLVGGTVADFMNEVALGAGQGQVSPMGVQPWEMTPCIFTPPPTDIATPPSSKTSPSR